VPRFSEQFIQQVAQATDIVDLISRHVSLKKRGREFVGLCPFHEDHSPSMYVSPAKQIFKCFACGAGGGVFNFVMLHEKQEFPEAVRTLAERANIPIPQDTAAGEATGLSRNDLLALAAFAMRFFQSHLARPGGAEALAYAKKRGFTDESIQKFYLGYAPDSWDAFSREARREGFREEQLIAAGLAARRENHPESHRTGGAAMGCYDRFRNRLMFPIMDVSGRCVAFGGRSLDANDRAKYLNSPEGTLFDKSATLYALNWSRDGIDSSGRAVVVEGYLDALMPLQFGVDNVVATLGTALTDRHVQLLSRYVKEAVLLFDSDAAGAAAAERAMEIFLRQQINVRVATVPEGKDPCDFVLARGGEAMRQLVADAPDAIRYCWDRRSEEYRAADGNLARQRGIIDDFLRLLVSSAAYGAIDEVRRGQLAQHVGHMLNIPAADLQTQMRRLAREIPRRSAPAPEPAPAVAVAGEPANLWERHVLEVLLNRPELFDTAAEKASPSDFQDETLRRIAESVWSLGEAGRLRLEEMMASETLAGFGGVLADLASAGEMRGNFEQTLAGALEHLEYRRGRQELQDLRSGALADDDALRRLDLKLRNPDVRRRPRIS
jgi:DNA primase